MRIGRFFFIKDRNTDRPDIFIVFMKRRDIIKIIDIIAVPFKEDHATSNLLGAALSPFNILMDIVTLPFINKKIYQLQDLPEECQAEINELIEVVKAEKVVDEHTRLQTELKTSFFSALQTLCYPSITSN
jgi:CRISPR/Cas system-associated endonuclease Cas3-HD